MKTTASRWELVLPALLLLGLATRLPAADNALSFDGVNDYVTFGQATGLGAATFTAEVWFKRLGTGVSVSTGSGGVTAIPLLSKGRGEADGSNVDMNYFLGIRASDGVLVADFEEGATGTTPGLNHPVAGVTPVSSGVWAHAALTYNGTKWQLFLNGVLERELTVGQPPRSDSIQHASLGTALNSAGAPVGFFHGVLDEARIWNVARTAQQIASNRFVQITAASGLLGRWGLNEGSGTIAGDSTGRGNNGALVNGAAWVAGYPFSGTNNSPPTVSITSPANNAVFTAPANITISASATDSGGSVTKVEFFSSATKLGEDTTAPYSLAWNNVAAGNYVLTARATDNVGLMATSASVSITVQSSGLKLTRGPYLQTGTPTSIIVRWRTDVATDSRVRLGGAPGSLSRIVDDAAVTTEHRVTVNGLSPDTQYYYSVGSRTVSVAGADANHFFVTPPPAGTPAPTRIWVLGDAGTRTASQRAVRDAYYQANGSRYTDLWLMLGDNAYTDGTDEDYQGAVFDMYPTMLRQSVLWSTRGNHERDANNTGSTYYNIFSLPRNGEAGGLASGTEAYYAFDFGNIHFVCLDSYGSSRAANGPMARWLRNDLEATTRDWIIAFWHHPPYSRGSHNSDTEIELVEMRRNLVPILEAGGVDLVLSGHSHSYERSYLLDGHYGTAATLTSAMIKNSGSGKDPSPYTKPAGTPGRQGAVYAVAGSSGQASGGSLNHPAMFISLNALGSVVVDVVTNRMTVTFLDSTRTTRDSFSIVKPAAAPLLIAASPENDVAADVSRR